MRGDSLQVRFKQIILISLVTSLTATFFSCAKKSDQQEAKGDVLVQIGLPSADINQYSLQTVKLIGINNLKEVSGAYAQFFYSPGSTDDQLTGNAPRANFVRATSFFVPMDVLSMQMATIYYHLQNLAHFDQQVGAEQVNQWPRAVGMETQISDQDSVVSRNNAFYNGQTDSMMFVPFTKDDLYISMNAGIIAHEHFHSLFYKIVLKPALKAKKITSNKASIHHESSVSVSAVEKKRDISVVISDKEKASLFNETFLRGINEGLADFWGWVYTEDPEFMRWSLPAYQAERTLNLAESLEGQYKTQIQILNKIDETVQLSDRPRSALIGYAYEIGTPYARFLKQLTLQQAEAKKINVTEAKLQIAQIIFNYIKHLSDEVVQLEENKMVDPAGLFEYVNQLSAGPNSLILFDQKNCEFVAKYLASACEKQKEDVSRWAVKKP